jgi:anti-sigma factor RsiW
MNASDIHALSGAYALDAVDDLERAAFERHLRDCATCALEVFELRETVTKLADAAAEPPPPRMRAAVLDAISRTPQAGPGRPDRGSTASATRWRRFAAVSVAAGVIAVGAGFGTWTVADQRVDQARVTAARERARVAEMEQVLSAPDARIRSTSAAGGTVNLVVSPSRDKAVAVLSGLRVPDNGLVYQLWLIRGSGAAMAARPLDVLGPGQTNATALIPNIAAGDQIGITTEVPAGAPQPTLERLVTAVDLR